MGYCNARFCDGYKAKGWVPYWVGMSWPYPRLFWRMFWNTELFWNVPYCRGIGPSILFAMHNKICSRGC